MTNKLRFAYPSETNGPIRGMLWRNTARQRRKQLKRIRSWKPAGYICRPTFGGMTMVRRSVDREYMLRGNLTVFGSKFAFTS